MAKREAVGFQNRNGQRLFGTLHSPSDGKREELPLIVLLSPGVKMRVGPHRLYNRMTETYCELGFAVLKFDFHGLGDSEGELNRNMLAEVYNDTETGAFVEDSIDALDWAQNEYGYAKFVLGGLCGGAITGILSAKNDPRVIGLLSLGMTVTLAMNAQDRTKFASQNELRALREGYFRRLLDPKSWARLMTFRSDFRTISRVLMQALMPRKEPDARPPGKRRQELSNANPLFPPAFFAMTESQRKVLLVFSEADRLYWDFQEKFAEPYSNELEKVGDQFELHVVTNANHVFSFREWEEEMLKLSSQWLITNYT